MTSSTGTVVFNDAKLQAIDVVATERLGVGTLDPTSNLHVVGNVHVTGNVNKLNFTDGYTIKRGANVTVFGTTDVIQEITGPHARESAVLKKYPEVSLASNAQSGYTVTASNASDTRPVWQVFDGSNATLWGTNGGAYNSGNPGTVASSGSYPGEIITLADSTQHDRGHWMKIKFPHKVRLSSYHISAGSADRRPASISILGSNDDSNWYIVKDVHSVGSEDRYTIEISASTAYRYALLLVHSIVGSDNQMVIDTIEYHGYEEVGAGDDSVDTTVKSVYNAPDLTSAALYIDATKPDSNESVTDQSGSGVTVTAVGVTHDSTENAWELTGAATSNIVSGNLASLVGDHPHSVSAWVKADVLNGDGLFHVGTAEGEGDAASRVGFVDDSHISWGGEDHFFSNAEWHNVTYTYNGEGSDKKLYLDGRRVATAKNENTFGEYPPFDMSGYSEYGYTVSASSDYTSDSNSIRRAWNAYEEGGQPWMTQFDTFSRNSPYGAVTSGALQGVAITDTNGTSHFGHYNKLETPFKLQVGYLAVDASVDTRRPGNVAILGSNDDENWDLLYTNASVTDTRYNDFIVNSTKGYKYHMFMVKNLDPFGEGALYIVRLQYYGHRENDLVRFPDSVNTLKYPHVAMTGPAQRGYVVSGSTHAFIPSSDSRDDPWRAFEGSNDVQNWKTHEMYTTAGVYSPATYSRPASSITDTGSTQHSGEYLVLETPRKITLSSWEVKAAYAGRRIVDYAILGSDTNSSSANKTGWTLLTNGTFAAQETVTATVSSPTTAFKYHAIVVKSVTNHSDSRRAQIDEMKLYGTEPEDVIARVGDGYDGKIRNLRVFSTALSDARVQEIFDADKDEFGLAKSSVSVYRGHLGVGTTEPKAALTVMDEIAELEEFPPRAMTDYETYMEGHGVFRVTYSPWLSNGVYQEAAWQAFDDSGNYHNNIWHSERNDDVNDGYYTGTDGAYTGTNSLGGVLGDYVILESPYKTNITKINLKGRHQGTDTLTGGQTVKSFYFMASNDNVTWDILTQKDSLTQWTTSGYTFVIPNTKYYKYYAVVPTKGNSAYVTLSELRYFGTREQGQSTLHDGQLTLTKNLTVPRIGPPLDADDTPRRDRLVVEYNTSTNPTANGTVKDTSGRGLDGLTYNGASYDASEKALVFDGSNDYVTTTLRNISGDFIFSASLWVYHENTTNNQAQFFTIGSNATNQMIGFRLNNSMTSVYVYFYSGNTLTQTISTVLYNWNHFVVTYNGSTQSLYQNGVLLGTNAGSGLNLPENPELRIGNRNTGGSNEYLDGYLSNFKLYDVVLTADEAKRLYDMGRCDEGHHVVNFSKTRVGIGLGDGEAPQAALDVRDLCEIKQLGVGMIGTGIHRPSIAPLSVCKDTFDELGGGIELMRTNTPEGNSGLGFNRGSAIWHAYKSSTNRETLYFAIGGGNYGTSSYDYNRVRGYIDTNNGGGNITFTGQHRAVVEGTPLHETEKYQGLIVSAKNNKYVKLNNGIETGSSAITINESVPLVSLSSVAQDKSCFGVISDSEDPDVREDRIGNFVTTGQKEKGDHRWFINSVGEGAIWVADMNGPLESGDYITTSNIAGYGQKQDGAGLMNYTAAKITMDCDFEPATQPIQCIKQSNVVETHYTGLVQVAKSVPHEFVTTVVSADDAWSNVSISPSDVTYAEWSNLESNVQNTYTLQYTSTSNVVYDVKYTKTTTANVTAEDAWDAVHIEPSMVTYAEYSNLEANVQNTYTLTYTMTTKVEATEAIYSNLSTEDKTLFIPTYYQMVEQTVDAEYPGAVKHETVTNRLENALDEHGQLQWEDDPSGAMEKAYKIRYLDASGQQTDEANCVHRAAFVGCTYHCG